MHSIVRGAATRVHESRCPAVQCLFADIRLLDQQSAPCVKAKAERLIKTSFLFIAGFVPASLDTCRPAMATS
eukprot:2650740-Alexandrium_andersonii.AAC.1